MKLSKILLLVPFITVAIVTGGQLRQPTEPRQQNATDIGLYLFPINPGQVNLLSGSMGELRSTHFHAGIDIRTNNVIGLPVMATQKGYISRVIVGTGGYGHAIFIHHPDGNTSLYGHLNQFLGPVANYVLQKQYASKSFDQDLFLAPGQYPVNRGDTIAFSGNTGGSAGPHLHFEIRDPNNEAMNPLTFGFTEIIDAISPYGQEIALKTLDQNSRINDHFGRFEFALLAKGNSYVLPQPILAHGKIGIELSAFDRMDNNRFRFAINYIEVLADSQKIFSQKIERVSFLEQRNILAIMDFKSLKTKGDYFSKLYLDDGNRLPYYKGAVNKGVITVNDKPVSILIKLHDTFGNKSSISFTLIPDQPEGTVPLIEKSSSDVDFDVTDNTLVLNQRVCGADSLKVFTKGSGRQIKPDYKNNLRNIYLVNLQKELPDSVTACSSTLRLNFKDRVPPSSDYTYFDERTKVSFRKGALFDTLFLAVNYNQAKDYEVFTIGNSLVPLGKSIEVTIKPSRSYPANKNVNVYRKEGDRYSFLGGEFANGKVRFYSIEMGDFVILKDSVPPTITKVQLNGQSANFRIKDALSGISYYEATVNGRWLLMKYDYKTGLLESERLDKSKPLQGDFVLKIVDNAGNEEIYKEKVNP